MDPRVNPNRHQEQGVVVALMLTVGLVLSGCQDSTDGGGPVADSSPGAPSSSAPDTADTADTDGAQPLAGDGGPLAPGTYEFSFLTDGGVETPGALVDVPSGFVDSSEGDDWYVVSQDGDTFLGLWIIGKVDRDACRNEVADAIDPGPSVDDLAGALVAQKSTRASGIEQVTLDGHRGLYVELVSPSDLSNCGKYPGLWRDPERLIYGAGQVDRVWIFDVDGQRLVADASYGSTATISERDNLTSMVESMEFVEPPQG